MFTWVEDPSSKITTRDKLGCGGDINYGNYCNTKASALLDKTATELDENTRTKLLNQSEANAGEGHPVHPHVRPAGVHDRCQA